MTYTVDLSRDVNDAVNETDARLDKELELENEKRTHDVQAGLMGQHSASTV